MQKVSQVRFNQGLLLAARAAGARQVFQYNGPKWNAAFDAVAEAIRGSELISSWWVPFKDPVGGVYLASRELIVQGEHDLLLGLIGSRSAAFLMKPEEALKELENEFPHLEWFKTLGRLLAEGLNTAV